MPVPAPRELLTRWEERFPADVGFGGLDRSAPWLCLNGIQWQQLSEGLQGPFLWLLLRHVSTGYYLEQRERGDHARLVVDQAPCKCPRPEPGTPTRLQGRV